MKGHLKTVCFIIGACTLFILVVHWINLAKRKSTIEKIEIALESVKKKIPENSEISFFTNLQETSPSMELYFQVQFVMCPVIVTQSNRDTILIVEQVDKDPLKQENMQVLLFSEENNFRVSLLKKK
jgi:hypothetical protein